MGTRRNPNGWSKYTKYTKDWESYVMEDLYSKYLIEFGPSTPITQKKVTTWLVENDWMEEIQKYAYKSVTATGRVISFSDFKKELEHFTTYEGDTINAWKNSTERAVSRRMVKRIKQNNRVLSSRLKDLEKTTDVKYLRDISKTMVDKPSGFDKRLRRLETNIDGMTEAQINAEFFYFKRVIKDDVIEKQYPAHVKETFDSVNNYQGKRLSRDQLQYSNNLMLADKHAEMSKSLKDDEVVRGEWKLSTHHKTHYYKGGTDPCEKFASKRYFYGDNMPVPVKSTHMSCSCSMTLTTVKK